MNYILIGIVLLSLAVFSFVGFNLGKNSVNPFSQISSDNKNLPSETKVSQSPQPTTSPVSPPLAKRSKDAPLVSTSGWRTESIDKLSLKLPQEAVFSKVNCFDNSYEYCYTITKHDPNHLSPPVSLYVKNYQGGSRRVEAKLIPNTLDQYSFNERMYGSIEGLDALFVCKIDGCTAFRKIVFVVGNNLVQVGDGVYKKDGDAVTLESPITNTIISSFKSN